MYTPKQKNKEKNIRKHNNSTNFMLHTYSLTASPTTTSVTCGTATNDEKIYMYIYIYVKMSVDKIKPIDKDDHTRTSLPPRSLHSERT